MEAEEFNEVDCFVKGWHLASVSCSSASICDDSVLDPKSASGGRLELLISPFMVNDDGLWCCRGEAVDGLWCCGGEAVDVSVVAQLE